MTRRRPCSARCSPVSRPIAPMPRMSASSMGSSRTASRRNTTCRSPTTLSHSSSGKKLSATTGHAAGDQQALQVEHAGDGHHRDGHQRQVIQRRPVREARVIEAQRRAQQQPAQPRHAQQQPQVQVAQLERVPHQHRGAQQRRHHQQQIHQQVQLRREARRQPAPRGLLGAVAGTSQPRRLRGRSTASAGSPRRRILGDFLLDRCGLHAKLPTTQETAPGDTAHLARVGEKSRHHHALDRPRLYGPSKSARKQAENCCHRRTLQVGSSVHPKNYIPPTERLQASRSK